MTLRKNSEKPPQPRQRPARQTLESRAKASRARGRGAQVAAAYEKEARASAISRILKLEEQYSSLLSQCGVDQLARKATSDLYSQLDEVKKSIATIESNLVTLFKHPRVLGRQRALMVLAAVNDLLRAVGE